MTHSLAIIKRAMVLKKTRESGRIFQSHNRLMKYANSSTML